MNTPTTPQSSAPAELVRHPPEVIEAAKAVKNQDDVDRFCETYDIFPHAVLRDALARSEAKLASAEADRDAFVDIVKEGKFPYTTKVAIEVCRYVFDSYRRVTTNLQECVQKYNLGFAGDSVDDILCREYSAERQRREKAERELAEIQELLRDVTDGKTVYLQREMDMAGQACLRLRDTRNRLLAQAEKLRADMHAVILDRSRFPDRPDQVGAIIGAHVEHLKSEARGNFEAWRLALARESIALRRVHDLERDLAEARKALDRVQDERAASFARIGKAAGGMSLTPYQPEADLEIEQAVKALRKDSERLDWLGENCTRAMDSERYLPRQIYWGGGSSKDIRQAIDAAREAGKGGAS